MFGIGMGEFVLILIVGLIIFGPKNLPEVGKALGKGLKEFRKAQAALSATLEESVNETPKKSESVKISTDETFKAAKEFSNTENKSAEISLEKKSESAKVSTDGTINAAKENSVPKEIYTGTAAAISIEKKSEPARMTVDDVINIAKENPISNTPAAEKISKEKTA